MLYRQKAVARIWMHNGLFQLGDEKMSKSIGNIVGTTVLEKHSADGFRVFCARFPLPQSADLFRDAIEAARTRSGKTNADFEVTTRFLVKREPKSWMPAQSGSALRCYG